MAIPDFDQHGLLPAGIHPCTLSEIERRLCWTAHRVKLWADFRRFYETRYLPSGLGFPFLLDGSFVRNKPAPADIDVIVDLNGRPAIELGYGLELRLQNPTLHREFRVDFNIAYAAAPCDIVAFFQYIGDKAALELSLQPSSRKGILRVNS